MKKVQEDSARLEADYTAKHAEEAREREKETVPLVEEIADITRQIHTAQNKIDTAKTSSIAAAKDTAAEG